MIIDGGKVSASAISSMIGYVARRANVCAKVIDRKGKISAVNGRGLELLQSTSEALCGKVWIDFWSGLHKETAENAVNSALNGRPSSFIGEFEQAEGTSLWEVEVIPLEWTNDEVSSVLVVSCRLSDPEPDLDDESDVRRILSQLGEALHSMSNLANISSSSARLLRRSADTEMVTEIAAALEEAAQKASAATAALKQATMSS